MSENSIASASAINPFIVTGIVLFAVAFFAFRFLFPGTHPLKDKPAPAFKIAALGGGDVDLADHLGKDIILLDFWASWCPPCRKALPIVAGIARDYAGRGVKVFAVNVGESAESAKAFLDKAQLDVPVLLDQQGQAAAAHAVSGIPQIEIIGRDGIVHIVQAGLSFNEDARLRAELDKLLAEPAESPE